MRASPGYGEISGNQCHDNGENGIRDTESTYMLDANNRCNHNSQKDDNTDSNIKFGTTNHLMEVRGNMAYKGSPAPLPQYGIEFNVSTGAIDNRMINNQMVDGGARLPATTPPKPANIVGTAVTQYNDDS